MRKIIAFTGPLKSGKTEAAKVLIGRGFTRVRFAGPLKQMMAALGLSTEEIEGSLKETPCALLQNKTPRFAMQTIGTEWGRNTIGPNLWIDAWKHAVNGYPQYVNVTCDDCRFLNEYETIKSLGGIVIRIKRDEAVTTVTHASEELPFDPDMVIDNNGTLNLFHEKIEELLK